MSFYNRISKRTALASAMTIALGSAAPLHTASATVYTFSWEGVFTMLDPAGIPLRNTSPPYYGDPTWGYGLRTQITGTFTYDTSTGASNVTIAPFDFFNGGQAVAHDVTTQTIGDGTGGAGTLMAGHLLFDWNGTTNINVGIIFDAQGMLGALSTTNVGESITAVGATPASNGITKGKYPIGAAPIATTVWDTNYHNDQTCVAGNSCLISNGNTIGGDPMDNGPFPAFSANFDITSMTLQSDGSGPAFTDPADVNTTPTAVRGDTVVVPLGTVTDEGGGVTVEYSIDGKAVSDGTKTWIVDDGTNNINVLITGTVTTVTVDWRATDAVPSSSFATQTATVTVNDSTAPAFGSLPADISVNVGSTAETITFEGPTSGHGTITATDAVDATPTIQWSLDQLNWTANTAGDESSNAFGSGANIVYWRVLDDTGNANLYQQQVTLNLPSGILGQPCTVDADLLNTAIGNRAMTGVFRMRDSTGQPVGEIDETVTGTMNTATICADTSCTDSGAALATTQPFFGNLWDTETIRLFGTGTYSFDACPGTIDVNGNGSDGSTKCDSDNTLSMTVGPNQLGGHMLFNWSVNRKIDVAVVWNYGCGSAQLVAADPDGDGIIGTKMVDGPFKGFNAAFDVSTAAGVQSITSGGYSSTIPTVNNPIANTSPLPISPGTIGTIFGGVTITTAQLSGWGAAADSSVISSCVGGCFDFSISGRTAGETIQVVLPLSEPIPFYSLYRKFNAGTNSWTAFVTNSTDSVKTAPLNADGSCPEPGAGDYTEYSSGILPGMLEPGNQCVQLTITDGGPNDADGVANGTVVDPGGVGVTSGPSAPRASTSGGGCSLSSDSLPATQRLDLWLLGTLLAWFGLRKAVQR